MNTKKLGNKALGSCIAYYAAKGCVVAIPLNDSQPYDLLVEHKGIIKRVQVKYTSQVSRNQSSCYTVALRSVSGTSRKTYGVVSETTADILFVVAEDGAMWSIPTRILEHSSSLHLNSSMDKFKRK